ncbi:MAG: sensor histidine kinase [Clostridiales bacterium]|nr:sensor histidine kinase [Clostridiales bacterium]
MKLKQRFMVQNISILLSAIIITGSLGLLYNYSYKLLKESHVYRDMGQTPIIVMERDNIVYNSEDLTMLKVKEILMNVSIENSYFEYEGNRYKIKVENFMKDGMDYKIIIVNRVIDISYYYKSLTFFLFIIFFIVFFAGSMLVQKRNMKNIINPIIDLTREMENLRTGELEGAITDSGWGEIRELGTAIEELRLQLKNSIHYQQKIDDNRKFLISSISHDLKTPVTSIRGYIDGILDGIADTKEKKEYYLLKAIEKTKMINTMIEDLLLYSKLDLNQMVFKKEKVSISEYIKGCILDHKENFLKENKTIISENRLTTESFVMIDIEKFNRVVQNIMDNAKKSIEADTGQLRLILRETCTSVITEFKDNGRGISKEDLPHVFERFYRLDTARGIEGSSGLGLAIAEQIVKGLGGRIWIISEESKGASVMISLKKVRKEEVVV